jgi:uncharacterized membrane protein
METVQVKIHSNEPVKERALDVAMRMHSEQELRKAFYAVMDQSDWKTVDEALKRIKGVVSLGNKARRARKE